MCRPRRKITSVRNLKAILRRSLLSKGPDDDSGRRPAKLKKKKLPRSRRHPSKTVPTVAAMMNPYVVLRRVDQPANWLPRSAKGETEAIQIHFLKTCLGFTKVTSHTKAVDVVRDCVDKPKAGPQLPSVFDSTRPFVAMKRVSLPVSWLPTTATSDGDTRLSQSLTTLIGSSK